MLFAVAGIGISQFIYVWGIHPPVRLPVIPQPLSSSQIEQRMMINNPVISTTTATSTTQRPLSTPVQSNKRIALTFDDGPYGTSTARILDILEREQVPATFFLIGKNVELHPEQVRREVTDGDVIGNHSYSHDRSLPTMSALTLRADISHAQAVIIKATCLEPQLFRIPHLFRPPYSRTSTGMIKEITTEGYDFAGWNIDPRDWDNKNSSSTVINNVLPYVRPDGIVIFHDGHEIGTDYSRENTIEALPVIIEALKKQGYTFVTIDKILKVAPYRTATSTTSQCN